jgi:hypothetical protein
MLSGCKTSPCDFSVQHGSFLSYSPGTGHIPRAKLGEKRMEKLGIPIYNVLVSGAFFLVPPARKTEF